MFVAYNFSYFKIFSQIFFLNIFKFCFMSFLFFPEFFSKFVSQMLVSKSFLPRNFLCFFPQSFVSLIFSFIFASYKFLFQFFVQNMFLKFLFPNFYSNFFFPFLIFGIFWEKNFDSNFCFLLLLFILFSFIICIVWITFRI